VYEQQTVRYPPRRGGRTVLIVVAVFAAVCCAGAGVALLASLAAKRDTAAPGVTARIGSSSDPAAGAGDPAQPPKPATPGLNDPVRDGVFEFTLLSVSCGHSSIVNGWLRAQPQGQFCVAQMRVMNIGSQPQRFADGNQKAYGPDGSGYAADTGAGVVANGNGDAVWNVVNPGNSLTAKVVFDIPRGATIVAIEVHDSVFSRGVRVQVR
jgi:Domain of unknown function (DUF4352)